MVRLREHPINLNQNWKKISIPIWFDWERTASLNVQLRWAISIPIWFDWEFYGKVDTVKCSLFQFLYGSIESSVARGGFEPPAHFNSYMVRLRENYLDSRSAGPNHFNSYMVRLRVPVPFVVYSHYLNFNSYMVRLRGSSASSSLPSRFISIPIWFDWVAMYDKTPWFMRNFNSYMVRLREELFICLKYEYPNFNSYMVRLRGYSGGYSLSDLKFQFLYGSIERFVLHQCS